MRCRNIRIHVEIPVDGAFTSGSTFCDGNGAVYSVDAVRKSCENIGNLPIIQYDEHGVEKVVGIAQSDEITLVLTDYATITTDAWFGYNIQKMCSVSASMATLAFSNAYAAELWKNFPEAMCSSDNGTNKYIETLVAKMGTAMFDARVFSIPKDEVCNCLIWRQQDATRNSIESVGHANFSQKELHGKSCNSIQDMLWKERGINWNDFPVDCKRGSACYKTKVKETAPLLNDKGDTEMVEVVRNRWVIDREPPIFSQERGYVEKWI